MIIEYIDGIELCDMPDIDDSLKNKIQQSINALHKHGMVSGDPHRGNFIIKMVRSELLISLENVLQRSVKRKIALT